MVSEAFCTKVRESKVPAYKLAQEVGIHHSTLSLIMNGADVRRSRDKIVLIGKRLGLSAEECFDNGEN